MPRAIPYRLLSTFIVLTAAAACVIAQTPGDLFREQMAGLKAYCTDRVLPRGDATCDALSLKPEDPLSTPEGRLAHSIKLPPTVPPKTYQAGMNSDEYFKELCQEAGEFIFERVTGVEGVMQVRPRKPATWHMLRDLYALEDPYGYRDWEANNPESFYVGPDTYLFLETPLNPGLARTDVIRHFGYDGRNRNTKKKETAASPKSRYGFIWRGISRPNDREMGIAGGEMIVLELTAWRVLGVKRGFAQTGKKQPYMPPIWWGKPSVCPGDSHAIYKLAEFVTKVLIPVER